MPDIELIPGNIGEPMFKTTEDYERWREEFIAAVAPEMEEHRRMRAQAEHEAFFGRRRR